MKKIFYFIIVVLIILIALKEVASALDDKMIYKSVNNEEMKIALTFDDGPHPKQTQEILNILKKYDVKATFFVVGQNTQYYPDVLRRVISDGHEIGNHTFTHPNINKSNAKTIEKELKNNHINILENYGYDIKLLRPPGGVLNKNISIIAEKLGYKIILWDIDTKDWAHKSVNAITENVIKNTKSGSIILFHDYIANGTPTPEALDVLIPLLQKSGYTFTTVLDLIESEQQIKVH